MKYLILGQGQLGHYYKDYFQSKSHEVVMPDLDIRNKKQVTELVQTHKPNVVINVAAMTDIDWCEKNQLQCFDVNTLGADVVAQVCQEQCVRLLHMSSGCVQESKTAEDIWSEEDPVSPLCFYAWTKVWAENLIMNRVQRHGLRAVILRPRQLLSAMVSPRNAITKMLTYKKFVDTPNSCTIVEDLMWVTQELLERGVVGVFNVVNPGVTSPYKIAQMLKQIVKPEMDFVKISKDELNSMTFAKRIDAVLSCGKLNSLGIELQPIDERLGEILGDFKKNLESGGFDGAMEQTEKDTREKLG